MRRVARCMIPLVPIAAQAGVASAAFVFFSPQPVDGLIPGRAALSVSTLNAAGGDAARITRFRPTFESFGGAMYVRADDRGTPGDAADDVVDLPNAGGPSPTLTSAGNGLSWVRIGYAPLTIQRSATPALADAYRCGIRRFGVDEETESLVSATGATGLGVAVLVLDSSFDSVLLTGSITDGGGREQLIEPRLFGRRYGAPPARITISQARVMLDVSRGPASFGPVVVQTDVGGLTVAALPGRLADELAIAGTGNARTISGANVDASDLGSYFVTFVGFQSAVSLRIDVVPEPTAGAALVGLTSIGRRRRTGTRAGVSR